MNIGFIGTGVMGASMVRNLLKHNFSVSVYNRTQKKAAALAEDGAAVCTTLKECAAEKDIIITMIGFPNDVEEVYFGADGIINTASKGSILIDMTTTSPDLSKKIYKSAKDKGLHSLDAPVSGGDTGAKNGTLSIMAGGDLEIFEKCLPIFEAMGTTINYEGNAGNGQHTKAANQIAIAGAIAGVCEALAYARKMGLDEQTMLNSIQNGAAGSFQMSNMAPRILQNDLNPGFYIKHYIKDMKIAKEEAANADLKLPVLETVLPLYEKLSEKGLDELGTQALIKYYIQ